MKTVTKFNGIEIVGSPKEYLTGETAKSILGDEYDRWSLARNAEEERSILYHCDRTRGAVGLVEHFDAYAVSENGAIETVCATEAEAWEIALSPSNYGT